MLSVDPKWVTVRAPAPSVEVVVILQPVVIVGDPLTPEAPEAAALTKQAVALGGLEVGAEHAEENQRGHELDQEEERQVCQTHSELKMILLNYVSIFLIHESYLNICVEKNGSEGPGALNPEHHNAVGEGRAATGAALLKHAHADEGGVGDGRDQREEQREHGAPVPKQVCVEIQPGHAEHWTGPVCLDDGHDDGVERREHGCDCQEPVAGPCGGKLGEEKDEERRHLKTNVSSVNQGPGHLLHGGRGLVTVGGGGHEHQEGPDYPGDGGDVEQQVDGREQHRRSAELLPGAGQGVEEENEEQERWHDVDNIMNLRQSVP